MAGVIERFNRAHSEDRKTGCWNVKPTAAGGYGKFTMFGRTVLAHRVAYELFNGHIPEKMMVCHECDNPRCVNPNHLFLGTAQDNMGDKVRKGRHVGAKKGSKHHKAKLTEWQVVKIKESLCSGVSQRVISEKYGVSQPIISNIKTGKRWSHVK